MADATSVGTDPKPGEARRPLRELERDAAAIDGDDEITRRESLETELIAENRSEEGEHADLEHDVGHGRDDP
jgi:hypothetical protein